MTAGGEFLDPADDRRASVRIGCVVVGVPARDEQDRIECCLRSILAAGDLLDPGTRVFVVLAADSCSDETEQIAGSLAANDSRLRVVSGCWRAAGTARAAAIADGLSSAQAAGLTAADTIWISTTDADTVVGPDWLLRQLAHADNGIHAVAGTVDLLDDADRTALVVSAFAANYPVGPNTHLHVHGANLGIRADAYLEVGGFPPIALAEDHAIWSLLANEGYRCLAALDMTVATSARLSGRAIGGFADTIAALVG